MGLLNYFNVKVDKKSHFLAFFCHIGVFCSPIGSFWPLGRFSLSIALSRICDVNVKHWVFAGWYAGCFVGLMNENRLRWKQVYAEWRKALVRDLGRTWPQLCRLPDNNMGKALKRALVAPPCDVSMGFGSGDRYAGKPSLHAGPIGYLPWIPSLVVINTNKH